MSFNERNYDAGLNFIKPDLNRHFTIRLDFRKVDEIACQYAASKVIDTVNTAPYGQDLRETFTTKLQEVSPGNFLWLDIALDVAAIKGFRKALEALDELKESASDIESLYTWNKKFIDHEGQYRDHCTQILSAAALAYKPLTISELIGIINAPP